MTKLKGRYYFTKHYGSDTWSIVSENDDDELHVEGVPTKEMAEVLRDLINNWIDLGRV